MISNTTYAHAESLPLARPDADTVAAALRTSGFTVLHHRDLDRVELARAVAAFKESVATTRPPATFFYYAGHGAEVDGTSYLIPVDAAPKSAAQINSHALSLNWVLNRLEEGGASLNLVVIDACRDTGVSVQCMVIAPRAC